MSNVATLPIEADRYAACVRQIYLRGLDLTGVPMRAQIRMIGDTPGAPLVDLQNTTNGNAEGLRLVSVTSEAGVPVSHVEMVINETTMEGLPYIGELGSATPLRWDWQVTLSGRKQRIARGDFIITGDGVTGADNAPANRPPAWSSSFSPTGGMRTGATLTFGDEIITITIDGANLVAPLAEAAEADRIRAEQARTGADLAAATALAASRYFPSRAAGEAASAADQLFSTDDGAGVLIYYRRTSAGSTEIGRALTPARLAAEDGAALIGYGTDTAKTAMDRFRLQIMATRTRTRDATFYGYSTEASAAQNDDALARAYAEADEVFIPGNFSDEYALGFFQMPARGRLFTRASLMVSGRGLYVGDQCDIDVGRISGVGKTNAESLILASRKQGFRVAAQLLEQSKLSGLQIGNCVNFRLEPGLIQNIGDPTVINPTSEGMGIGLFACSDYEVGACEISQTYGLGAVFQSECQRARFDFVKIFRTRYRGIDIEGNTTKQIRFEKVDIQQTGYYASAGQPNNGVGTNGVFIGPIIDKNEVQIVAGLIQDCGENCLEGTYTTGPGLTCQRSGWPDGLGGALDTPSKEVLYISGGGAAIIGGLFKNGGKQIILGGFSDQGPTTIIGAELVKPGAGFYAIQSFAVGVTLSEIILENVICKTGGGAGAGGINLATSGGGGYARSYATNCKSEFTNNNIDPTVSRFGNLPVANFPS